VTPDEEIVRRGFSAMDAADMDTLTADWADDVVWDVSGYARWPGDRTSYTGAPEILAAYAGLMSTVRVLKVDLIEITAVAPGRVLALYTETRRLKDAPDAERVDVGIVYDLRDGVVVRMRVLDDHERARSVAAAP